MKHTVTLRFRDKAGRAALCRYASELLATDGAKHKELYDEYHTTSMKYDQLDGYVIAAQETSKISGKELYVVKRPDKSFAVVSELANEDIALYATGTDEYYNMELM